MNSAGQQPLEVVRIIRRSHQGVTLPFLCEVADGRRFWAKGKAAGKRALCCEWLAGSLAQALDLPIPYFAPLNVSAELIAQSMMPSVADLGGGIVFGSEHIQETQELGIEDAYRIMRQDSAAALRTLVFDWWVQNADRSLGALGGNPNLLIGLSDQRLHLIDHNLAFDDTWLASAFFEQHVFAAVRNQNHPEQVQALRERLREVRGQVDAYWAAMPEGWLFLDDEKTLPVELTPERLYAALDRVETEWEGTWL